MDDPSSVIFDPARRPSIEGWKESLRSISDRVEMTIEGDLESRAKAEVSLDGVPAYFDVQIRELSASELRQARRRKPIQLGLKRSRKVIADFEEDRRGFNFIAMECCRAAFALASSGLCVDEDMCHFQSTQSLVHDVDRDLVHVRLDLAFIRAGAEGLTLEEIHAIDPNWLSPEQEKARGCDSDCRACDGEFEGRFKWGFGIRSKTEKDLIAMGYEF